MERGGRTHWSRREFLGGLAIAGSAGLMGLKPEPAAAEPPPETSTIRIDGSPNDPTLCLAFQNYDEGFLRSEGFTNVQFVDIKPPDVPKALARDIIDMTIAAPGVLITAVDRGEPIAILGGVHVGCYELFGTDRIRSIRELKGKSAAAGPMGSGRQIFLAGLLAYLGLDPRKDVNWITHPPALAMRLFAEGKIDAFLGFPPEPQELRAKKIGHVLVNTIKDRPWSQYFCCNVAASREFIRKYPVATKRALRAVLKATDVCAQEPERAARFLVDSGHAKRYDLALQVMKEIPYNKWREYDSEDSIRFYSLRFQEGGLIKSSPARIIAQGTDWRFLKELKRELKG
jgi:NitT/TauT family transport system substrate-binding protein